jgi:hypothetical protein
MDPYPPLQRTKVYIKSEEDFEELKLTIEGRIDWKKVTN